MKGNQMSKKLSVYALLVAAAVSVTALGGCQCTKKEEAPAPAAENTVPADELNTEAAPADGGATQTPPTEAAPAQ